MAPGPIAVVFLLVFGVVVGAFWLFVQRPEQQSQQALHRRLKGELVLEEEDEAQPALVEVPRQQARRLEGLAAQAGGGFLHYLAVQIERADMDLPPLRLAAMAAGTGVVCAILFARLSPLWMVAIPLGLAAGWLPIAWVRMKANRRVTKFEEQFPEAIDLLARALRAGHALTTALSMVGDEMAEPVGPEFRLLFDQQNYGMPLPQALKEFASRTPIIDARFFVTAVLTQRESGGNLSEVLDNLANIIRDRFRVKRQVRVISAHGRITGWVLSALPTCLGLFFAFTSPEIYTKFYHDPFGIKMIVFALGMQVLGVLIIQRIVQIEY